MSNVFTVELPSVGYLYDGKLPGGKVTLRPMGADEESLLFQQGGDPTTKIARILDSCYQDKAKFPAQDLLVIDRFYMLVMLRIEMFGAVYEIPYRCGDCKHQRKMRINIIEELEKKKMKDVKEPFPVELPSNSAIIEYRLLRGSDEEAVSKYATRLLMKSADSDDPSGRYRIARQIVTINGEEQDEAERIAFANSLSFPDAHAFRQAVNGIEGGLDPTIVMACPKCGFMSTFMMPFTAEFFQPSARIG